MSGLAQLGMWNDPAMTVSGAKRSGLYDLVTDVEYSHCVMRIRSKKRQNLGLRFNSA